MTKMKMCLPIMDGMTDEVLEALFDTMAGEVVISTQIVAKFMEVPHDNLLQRIDYLAAVLDGQLPNFSEGTSDTGVRFYLMTRNGFAILPFPESSLIHARLTITEAFRLQERRKQKPRTPREWIEIIAAPPPSLDEDDWAQIFSQATYSDADLQTIANVCTLRLHRLPPKKAN